MNQTYDFHNGLVEEGEEKGGKCASRKREKRNTKSIGLIIQILNFGSMRVKGRELVDMMPRRNVDTLCVWEIKWKSSKARIFRAGFMLFCNGADRKRNGVAQASFSEKPRCRSMLAGRRWKREKESMS